MDLKELDDSLAPWIAAGATKLEAALTQGLEAMKKDLKAEEDSKVYDAITAAVAGNVANELPQRLIFQTAVQLYMDSLPKSRGVTQDIQSAPTLVEKYIKQNRKKVESAARARLGLRAIVASEGISIDEELIREQAMQIVEMNKGNESQGKVVNGNGNDKEEEKLEDSKEWRSAKHAMEMDAAVEWLRDNIKISDE